MSVNKGRTISVDTMVELVLGALLDRISVSKLLVFTQTLCVSNLNRKLNLFFLDSIRVCRQFSVLKCDVFTDLTVVDNLGGVIKTLLSSSRFIVVYMLLSIHNNFRVLVTTGWSFRLFIRSISGVFGGACWAEREAFDLFGIIFWGNPDLRRILTDYGFFGFPLQKDFPLCGLLELSFSDEVGSLLYTPVSFPQRYRIFKLVSYRR